MDIWFFKDGERVEVGDLVAEIAMDKVDRESKAEHSGVLRVLVAEEEAVMQGTVVDRIGRKAQSACWRAW